MPDPSQKELKRLNNILYSFIWASKRDPIKRAKLIQDYSNGGLCMIDVQAFIKSMKLTWLKKLTQSQAIWAKISAIEVPNIQDIICYGSKHVEKIANKLCNQFWKNVLEAFACFTRKYHPDVPEILSEMIWFSDHTKFTSSVIRNWQTKGIRFIIDLFDENTGLLHTKESLEQAYNIKMTYLCFTSLVRSLPDSIKSATFFKLQEPKIPTRLNMVINHPHFTRFAYNQLVKQRQKESDKTSIRLKQKWERDIGCFDNNSFLEVVNATKSSYNRMFHYRLVNRIMATNRYLHIINIKDSECCTFCKTEPETLAHLFWHCPKTKNFITAIQTELLTKYDIQIRIEPKTWFFPTDMTSRETCIITLAKMVIYRSRCNDSIPNITHFRNKIKQEVEKEGKIAERNSKHKSFEEKWGALKNININT